jgi:hypothetical protein
MLEHLRTWLNYPANLVERLTAPGADIGESDAVLARLLKGSAVSRAAAAAAALVVRAQQDAHVVRSGRTLSAIWFETAGADRNRLVALFMVCLGTTALAGVAVRSAGPLSWILPASIVVIGVFLWLIADPLARAVAARRS